jgi:hypothetical protein
MPSQTVKMIPLSQVLTQFSQMPDGAEQLEKAYPGLQAPMGYLRHVKIDPTNGAWMVAVPQHIEDELAVHNIVQGSKINAQQMQGQKPLNVSQAPAAAPAQAAQGQMTKQKMQASLSIGKVGMEKSGPQLSIGQVRPANELKIGKVQQDQGMPTPADEPNAEGVQSGTPTGSQPGPTVESPGMQPDVPMAPPKVVTPFMASVLPTRRK